MKILFVYPDYPETFWSFSHAMRFLRIFTKKAAFPPLGILTVSSLLPKSWEKRLVDMNVKKLRNSDILWADMIFVSAMVVQRESVLSVTKRCKLLGKTVVVGGPLFSEENMGDFPYVDHFVMGEGEMSVPPFVADVGNKSIKKMYFSEIKPDLCSTPLPDWSLINNRNYATMMVQFSRGCPYDCEFCDITKLNGRIPRTKGPQQIVAELETLWKTGWRGSVFFVDDNFIGNRKHVKEALVAIGEWMKQRKFPFTFLTEASVNLAEDDELLELMIAANFNSVFLGLETPDEQTLIDCNKMQNTRLNPSEAVKTLQQRGLQVQAGFIVGFDSDAHDIFDRQIQFIQNIGVVTAMVGLLSALRGTKLHIRLEKEGRLLAESSGNNTDGHLNFVPKMDPKILVDGYKRIIHTIYSPKEYSQRILTFIEQYVPRYKSGMLGRNEIAALLRSILYLGVFSSSRKYYWKTVILTLKRRPEAIADVISLLIVGHHCHRISRSM